MIYTLATASALAFSPQAGVPAGRAAVRNQVDISMMARTPLMAGNWKVSFFIIFFAGALHAKFLWPGLPGMLPLCTVQRADCPPPNHDRSSH